MNRRCNWPRFFVMYVSGRGLHKENGRTTGNLLNFQSFLQVSILLFGEFIFPISAVHSTQIFQKCTKIKNLKNDRNLKTSTHFQIKHESKIEYGHFHSHCIYIFYNFFTFSLTSFCPSLSRLPLEFFFHFNFISCFIAFFRIS